MQTITIFGELVIDTMMGVIWFNSEEGMCNLRICRLPKIDLSDPIFKEGLFLDITHMRGCNWKRMDEKEE